MVALQCCCGTRTKHHLMLWLRWCVAEQELAATTVADMEDEPVNHKPLALAEEYQGLDSIKDMRA